MQYNMNGQNGWEAVLNRMDQKCRNLEKFIRENSGFTLIGLKICIDLEVVKL